MKECTKCGIEKPLEAFAKHKLGKNGLRPRCRECSAEDNAEWRSRTVEQRAEYNRLYRLENRERHVAYNLAWNKAHREKTDAATSAWRKRNPDKYKAQKLKHRVLRKTAVGVDYTTDAHVRWRRELYGFKCFYCGGPDETIDHRISLKNGGTHYPANLLPCCRSCNSQKRMLNQGEFTRLRASQAA